MNDQEIIKLLELAVSSGNTPELNDEQVDAIFLEAEECSAERTERVRKRYIEKILEELNPVPVTKIENKTTFGRWFEAARTKVKLSASDIALPLGKEPALIEQIEKGEILPWECEPKLTADLMSLFRLHFDALTQLVSSSVAVTRVRGVGSVQARSRGGKTSKERGDSTARALELFLANNAAPVSTPEAAVTEWMENLRRVLKDREQNELIRSTPEAR